MRREEATTAEVTEAKVTMPVLKIGTEAKVHAETSVTGTTPTGKVGEMTGSAVEMAIKVPETEAVFPLTEVPTRARIKDHATNLSLKVAHNQTKNGIFPVKRQKIRPQENFYPSHL